MTHFLRMTPLIAALALAACGCEPEVDPQLKADLEAASADAIELAPLAPGTKVVSGIEQVQGVQNRPTAPPPRTSVIPPRTTERSEPAPQATEPAAAVPGATVPTRPTVQPPPSGGYKTVDEVIRNAPFPIKPASTTP